MISFSAGGCPKPILSIEYWKYFENSIFDHFSAQSSLWLPKIWRSGLLMFRSAYLINLQLFNFIIFAPNLLFLSFQMTTFTSQRITSWTEFCSLIARRNCKYDCLAHLFCWWESANKTHIEGEKQTICRMAYDKCVFVTKRTHIYNEIIIYDALSLVYRITLRKNASKGKKIPTTNDYYHKTIHRFYVLSYSILSHGTIHIMRIYFTFN